MIFFKSFWIDCSICWFDFGSMVCAVIIVGEDNPLTTVSLIACSTACLTKGWIVSKNLVFNWRCMSDCWATYRTKSISTSFMLFLMTVLNCWMYWFSSAKNRNFSTWKLSCLNSASWTSSSALCFVKSTVRKGFSSITFVLIKSVKNLHSFPFVIAPIVTPKLLLK